MRDVFVMALLSIRGRSDGRLPRPPQEVEQQQPKAEA